MTNQKRDLFVTPESNPHSVSAHFLRNLLEISQQYLTPSMYHRICQETGLGPYADDLPVASRQVFLPLSFDQISRYMAKIFEVTKEGVYPLFCHNVGVAWSNHYINSGQGDSQKKMYEAVFRDPKLSMEEKVNFFAVENNKVSKVVSQVFIPEGANLLLDCKDCVYCKYIKTDKMVCTLVKGYFTNYLRWVTGAGLTCEQIQSVTRGDSSCVHRFTTIV